MPKCIAQGAATWRGQPIEIAADGTCEISDDALDALRAHGFAEWEAPDRSTLPPVEALSRHEMFDWLKERGVPTCWNMANAALRLLVLESREGEHGRE
ncbi:MAG TPA: hypothetical protein VGF97_15735 [Rhizomicrobium sp.]|jgi:hypothetical protein